MISACLQINRKYLMFTVKLWLIIKLIIIPTSNPETQTLYYSGIFGAHK